MAAATSRKGRRIGSKGTRVRAKAAAKKQAFPFERTNFILFGCGVLCVIAGYLVMPIGDVYGHLSITVAPILIMTGILVFIPLSLFYKKKKQEPENPHP